MKTITRSADANWKGGIQSGHGLVTPESRVFVKARFALQSRIEGDGKDTNPEELLAAAAAACFSMALSKTLNDQGKQPQELRARADVGMVMGEDGPNIRELKLMVEGIVPDLDEDAFHEAVQETADTCPVLLVLSPGFEEVSIDSRLLPM